MCFPCCRIMLKWKLVLARRKRSEPCEEGDEVKLRLLCRSIRVHSRMHVECGAELQRILPMSMTMNRRRILVDSSMSRLEYTESGQCRWLSCISFLHSNDGPLCFNVIQEERPHRADRCRKNKLRRQLQSSLAFWIVRWVISNAETCGAPAILNITNQCPLEFKARMETPSQYCYVYAWVSLPYVC